MARLRIEGDERLVLRAGARPVSRFEQREAEAVARGHEIGLPLDGGAKGGEGVVAPAEVEAGEAVAEARGRVVRGEGQGASEGRWASAGRPAFA